MKKLVCMLAIMGMSLASMQAGIFDAIGQGIAETGEAVGQTVSAVGNTAVNVTRDVLPPYDPEYRYDVQVEPTREVVVEDQPVY